MLCRRLLLSISEIQLTCGGDITAHTRINITNDTCRYCPLFVVCVDCAVKGIVNIRKFNVMLMLVTGRIAVPFLYLGVFERPFSVVLHFGLKSNGPIVSKISTVNRVTS